MSTIFKVLITLFVIIIIGTSCKSTSILYDPAEVEYLSQQLRIPIKNNDVNMPLFAEVSLWLGTPYQYGGNSKKGVDCSGFVYQVYDKVYTKKLARSSNDQANKNVRKINKNKLSPGDLIFFATSTNSKNINHVGVFLRDNLFIHASTSKGIIVSSLDEVYYKKTLVKFGRVK